MTAVVGVAAGRHPRLAVTPGGDVLAAWCEDGDVVLTLVGPAREELARLDAGDPPLALALAIAPLRAVVAWTAPAGGVVALPGGPVWAGPATLCEAAAGGPGVAVVVWGADGEVLAASDDGGGWGPAERLGEGFAPQAAVGPDGMALAAWTGRDGDVRVAERPPGGRWAPAPPLTAASVGASGLRLAVGPGGWAALAWTACDATVRLARRPPGGAWGASAAVSAPGEPAYAPRIAAGPAGVLVAWHRADMTVRVASARWDAVPRPPLDLSPPGEDATYPSPALGAAGDAVVAWRTADGGVVTRRRGAGGPWQAARPAAPSGAAIDPPVAAVAADGRAVVAWTAPAPVRPRRPDRARS